MRIHRAAGFTLVEIVVVLAIVALLAAIIVPVFSTSSRRVNQQTCMNNLHVLGVNLTQYWQDYGAYPAAPLPRYLHTLDPKYVPFGFMPTSATCSAINNSIPADELKAVSVYTGADPSSYHVTVAITDLGSGGSPDKYSWVDANTGLRHGPFPIPDIDTRLPISQGVSILFSNTNGHMVNDAWTITLQPNLPAGWRQWEPAPTATTVGALSSGVSTITVDSVQDIYQDQAVLLRDADGANPEPLIVKAVDTASNTFQIYRSMQYDHPDQSVVEPGDFEFTSNPDEVDYPYDPSLLTHFITGNYGLAQFLPIYGLNKSLYHCPEIASTEDVETDTNLRAATAGTGYTRSMRFDTLLSGFNTYDVTYNYNQYSNAIRYFDARLGFGELNEARQLQEPYPPADTVVCWCYGHRPDQTSAFDLGSPDNPDVIQASAVNVAEQNQRNKKVLVLWVDGTVAAMSPYLTRGADNAYYWVPPFLYSRGEWQK